MSPWHFSLFKIVKSKFKKRYPPASQKLAKSYWEITSCHHTDYNHKNKGHNLFILVINPKPPPTISLPSLQVVPSLPAADENGRACCLCWASWLRQDVAPSMLRVLYLHWTTGGHDLLLEERQALLRTPLWRQWEATLRRLWWGERDYLSSLTSILQVFHFPFFLRLVALFNLHFNTCLSTADLQ